MAQYAVLQSFYASDKWIKFRLNLILERGNKCEKCGRIIPKSIDIIGHHEEPLTPENVNDYNISLNPKKVKLVCFDCHNQIEKRFGYKPEKKVYIVYGAPLAGKKTYVRQQLQRGDIVVDMDKLYEAVTMLPYFDKPDCLLSNVRAVHNLLIDNIKTRYGKWNNAWVIGGYAEKFKREKLAEELGSELIFCDVSKEECLSRLVQDNERRNRQTEWKGYIDKWFDEYSE